MIKAILFDLDGVLVDACEWHYESLNRALLAVGCPAIEREDHVSTYNGLPTKQKLDILTSKGLLKKDLHEKVWELKQEFTFDVIKEKAKIDRQKIILHEYLYQNKIKIGCVTNSIRKSAEMMLEKTGQIFYMNILVSNEDIKPNKPDPAPYLYAMNFLKVEKHETIVVEDSEKGIKSGLDSGAFVVRVNNAKDVYLESVCFWMKGIEKIYVNSLHRK